MNIRIGAAVCLLFFYAVGYTVSQPVGALPAAPGFPAIIPLAGEESDGTAAALFNERRDRIHLSINRRRGTFQIYAVDAEGAMHELLSQYDEGMTSFFALRIGRAQYKLQYGGMKIAAEQTEDGGGTVTYTIPRRAQVELDFEPFKSNAAAGVDMLKVTATITNTSSRRASFGFKAVFDTVLGESGDVHFSTAAQKAINTELQLYSMALDRYITSSDGTHALQFVFTGRDTTPPAIVTLGNKDILTGVSSWIPPIIMNRPFDNVISYNNSAIAANWNDVQLEPTQRAVVVFYIAAGSDGATNPAEVFLKVHGYGSPEPGMRADDVSPPAAPPAMPPVAVVSPVPTAAQLETAYIQNLINRINALEENSVLNRSELLELNAELDAILAYLRQLN
ncbi:MAG: hypothetical protein IJ191_03830 [Treponema sp.]|nr:hypothetical protein [Treponema sp.]